MAEAMPYTATPVVEAIPFEAIPVLSPQGIDAIPLAPVADAPMNLAPIEPFPMALETMPVIPLSDTVPPIEPENPTQALSAAPPAAPVVAPVVAPLTPVVSAPPPAPAQTTGEAAASLPAEAQPRLLVLRGQKRNVEYPLYEGLNFIGRADEKPVDIDLEEQEPPDRIWCSRQHACISFEGDQLAIEDLNSANGTYVNRTRVYPGQKRALHVNDIIQIGNVQLKVLA
jgi:hypothetical protein